MTVASMHCGFVQRFNSKFNPFWVYGHIYSYYFLLDLAMHRFPDYQN